jgi:hypothetical protein
MGNEDRQQFRDLGFLGEAGRVRKRRGDVGFPGQGDTLGRAFRLLRRNGLTLAGAWSRRSLEPAGSGEGLSALAPGNLGRGGAGDDKQYVRLAGGLQPHPDPAKRVGNGQSPVEKPG